MSAIAAPSNRKSILIATDFSSASEKALRHSLALASFYQAKLCLVHVVSSVGLTIAGPGAIAACEEAVLRKAAELENSLRRSGALNGIEHKFIVRRGELWPELREIIRQENADLVLVGTHGRHGVGKLLFGSIAEQIFRQADCPVLTFGPHSDDRAWFETLTNEGTFLFATDFGHASVRGLPQAIEAAAQFGTKLAFLSIVPDALTQEDADTKTMQRLSQLADHAALGLRPELYAEIKSARPISETILETAAKLHANLIIMGVHDSALPGVISHLDLPTTYEVMRHAACPVLTFHRSSGYGLRRQPAAITRSLWSEADLIHAHGFGAKW